MFYSHTIIHSHILSCLVELPFITAVITQFMRHNSSLRKSSNIVALLLIILSTFLLWQALSTQSAFEESSLLLDLPLYYASKMNSLLVMLSNLCAGLLLYYQHQKGGHHTAIIWYLLSLMNGFFLSDHLLALFIFFEASLIPLFYWMTAEKNILAEKAAVQMFLYTAFGSAFLLLGILYISACMTHNDWSINALYQNPSQIDSNLLWLGACFFLAFLIKIPLWPAHSWLPYAHTEAPTSASVLLAAVILKMGAYGLIRLALPFFAPLVQEYATMFYVFSLIGITAIALIAWVQSDIKKIVAYSSISHMAFVVLALTAAAMPGVDKSFCLQAAVFQCLSHGCISAGLFFCVGFLYDRCHTRHLKSYGGVGALLPWLTFYMTFFILANTGLPGLSGFIGELSILWVSYSYSPLLACLAATSLVFSAIVNLRLLIAIFYGPTSGDILDLEQNNVADCRSYEHHILLILAGLTLFFGLWPQYIFQWLEPESLRLAHVISQLKGAF